jgi:hypothetical protein
VSEAGSLVGAPKGSELLSKSNILQDQMATGRKETEDQSEKEAKQTEHS